MTEETQDAEPSWDSLSLQNLRNSLRKFAEIRDWQQFHTPRNLLLAMVGEVGELSELFQWRGDVSPGLPEFSPEEKIRVGEELSDVLLYLVRLSDRCGIDLAAAAQRKIKRNEEKYPSEACRGKSAKYHAYATEKKEDGDGESAGKSQK